MTKHILCYLLIVSPTFGVNKCLWSRNLCKQDKCIQGSVYREVYTGKCIQGSNCAVMVTWAKCSSLIGYCGWTLIYTLLSLDGNGFFYVHKQVINNFKTLAPWVPSPMSFFFLLKIHTYTGTRAFSVYRLITLCRGLPRRNVTKLLQFSDLAVSCARNYIIVVLQIFAQFTGQEFSMKSYVCNVFTEWSDYQTEWQISWYNTLICQTYESFMYTIK